MRFYPTATTRCFLLLALLSFPLSAQEARLTVSNPAPVERVNEPAVFAWNLVEDRFAGIGFDRLRLLDERGASLAFQVDDIDGDGILDECSFTCTIASKGTRTLTLTAAADSLPGPLGPPRTDAANYKQIGRKAVPVDDDDGPGTLRSQGHYPFDGVGWESELVGYRLYLDERNAIDIQAKRIPGLHWDFIGRTGVNYQLDAYWGMDVLHVGPSFGFGGIALTQAENIFKPTDLTRRRTRILSRGPVRVVVRVDYGGWKVAETRNDIASTFIMYAGDRITEHSVTSAVPMRSLGIATGIVRHQHSDVAVDRDRGFIRSQGRQSRNGDSLTMILAFPSDAAIAYYQTDFDDAVRLTLDSGRVLRMYLSSIWQNEPNGPELLTVDSTKELERVLLRVTDPLRVDLR